MSSATTTKPTSKKPSATDKDATVQGLITISATITPYGKKNEVEYTDAQRLTGVQAHLRDLHPELSMRRADGQVPAFVFSCERGLENNKPHEQGTYDLMLTTATSIATVLKDEKNWLKSTWSSSTELPAPIIKLRVCRAQDRSYLIGYCLKDEGAVWCVIIHGGLTQLEMNLAGDVYRAQAGKSSFTSKKMQKNPKADETQLVFKLGNKTTLAVWFVHQHELDVLHPQLVLSLIIGWAIETGRYRLDDEVVHGKNGGAALEATRTDAMLQLCFLASSKPPPRVTVPLIEVALYGSVQLHAGDNGAGRGPGFRDVPSTRELLDYNLRDAKALAALLRAQGKEAPSTGNPSRTDSVDTHPHGGRFIVIDFLSSAQSAEVAVLLERAGLERHTMFDVGQLPNACGYLAAGWALMLHALGTDIVNLDYATAATINCPTYIASSNVHLDLSPPADETAAVWLTGDQILGLVNNMNTAMGTRWLAGPGPLNYFRTMFNRTLTTTTEHGVPHIMIVNTENAYSLSEAFCGAHWFVVAWVLDPAPTMSD